jgi:hypothetical protein
LCDYLNVYKKKNAFNKVFFFVFFALE